MIFNNDIETRITGATRDLPYWNCPPKTVTTKKSPSRYKPVLTYYVHLQTFKAGTAVTPFTDLCSHLQQL